MSKNLPAAPPSDATIRVFLVDDHALMREGTDRILRDQPDIEVVGEAETAEEARLGIERLRPDVAVLDIKLKQGSGIEVARWVRHELPDIRLLVLSGYDYDQYVRAAIRIGVQGYLLKSDSGQVVVNAVRAVAAGETIYPEHFTRRVFQSLGRETRSRAFSRIHLLSPREIEVARLLADGEKNAEIAQILHVNIKTVEKHVGNIIEKLGARSRTEAALTITRNMDYLDERGPLPLAQPINPSQ